MPSNSYRWSTLVLNLQEILKQLQVSQKKTALFASLLHSKKKIVDVNAEARVHEEDPVY